MNADFLDGTGQEETYKPILTTEYLTKYEKARVLGIRAMQISKGSPVQINVGRETDPLAIAERELEQGATPLIIRRHLPNGSFEDVAVCELYGGGRKA